MTSTVWRFRLAAVCLLLTTFSFLQSPGEVAADTKLDLTVDPVGFLERALTLWDSQGFFGQLQNQAYGYLFPMGPFFAVGDLVALPPWVIQRLWWAGLLCVAFLGVVRLASLILSTSRDRAAGSHLRWAAMAAGLVYALAPRIVTTLGPISAEALPMALAPWMVVPLVLADRGRNPRRMAALSGVAVAGMGAVNAVAVLVVLPLGAWWIATRRRARVRLAAWWGVALALATLWWVAPLLILGRFSPPFLDWIEAAAVTTRPNDAGAVLRGTSHWVAYVLEPGGPVWPAGWSLVASPLLVLATGGVVAVALAGLARADLPERTFLVGAAAIGLALVSLGHTGAVQGLGAEAVQDVLDGVLAPMRNVHKADVVLRLALAVAVGHSVAAMLDGRAARRAALTTRSVVTASLVVMLGASAMPFWSGSITEARTHGGIPGYWDEAAAWLSDQGGGRALVVPGSSFGVYIWGRAQDEPLQPLAASPWAVRDAVPLSSAGNIRLLDAVDDVLASGMGSSGLAEVLARSGVRWVIVRNDLSAQSRPPRPILIHQALDRSPGLAFRGGFGPVLPPFRSGQEVVDDGLQQPYTPVEVWEVAKAPRLPVKLRPADSPWEVVGGSEALLALGEAGLLGERATVLAGEPTAQLLEPVTVVTDTYRRTEIDFGQVRDNRSATLTADAPFELERGVHDYYPVDAVDRQPVVEQPGYSVDASSSGASVTALRARQPSSQPWSAVDGDRATAWVSGDLGPGVGQWWEVTWDEPVLLDRLRVAFVVGSTAGTAPAAVMVSTDAGEATSSVRPTDQSQQVGVVPGETRTMRITLTAVEDGTDGDAFGIAEITIPDSDFPRAVEIPGAHDAGAIVLSARTGERFGCVHSAREVQCSRQLPRAGEERSGIVRYVEVEEPGSYRTTIRLRPRPGLALDRLLAPPEGRASLSSSSRLVSDPASGPAALVDGDPRTAWLADPLDQQPTIVVALPEQRDVSGLTIDVPPELAASRPLGVTVRADGGERPGYLDQSGELTFAPLRGASFEVGFGISSPLTSRDPLTGTTAELPVGMAELRLVGAEDLMRESGPLETVGVPCGFGPELSLDGVDRVETSVSAPSRTVTSTAVVSATTCRGELLTLSEGRHLISVPSTEEFLVEQVELVRMQDAGATAPARVGQPTVRTWSATERTLRLPRSDVDRVLETTENFNEGWDARAGSTDLDAVQVDGWRQGWLIPSGVEGDVRLSFTPQRWYQGGLVAGAVALAGLVGMAVLPARRGRLAVPGPPDEAGQQLDAGRRSHWWTTAPVIIAVLGVAGVPGLAVVALTGLGLARRPSARLAAVLAAWGSSVVIAALAPWPQSISMPAWASGVSAVAALTAFVAAALAHDDIPGARKRSTATDTLHET